jgi:hypothetical protein
VCNFRAQNTPVWIFRAQNTQMCIFRAQNTQQARIRAQNTQRSMQELTVDHVEQGSVYFQAQKYTEVL